MGIVPTALFEPQPLRLDPSRFADDPAFQVWIAEAMARGQLEKLLQTMVRFRIVRTSEEALDHLATVSKSNPIGKLVLASSDVAGKQHTKPFLNLRREIGEEIDRDYELLRRFGVYGHSAVRSLWSGQTFDLASEKDVAQAALFAPPAGQSQEAGLSSGIFAGNKRERETYLKNLFACWQALSWCITSEDWMENYQRIPPKEVARLREFLRSPFGSSLDSLAPYENADPYHRYLAILTLMTWASAAIHIANSGRRALFGELPLMPRYYGFGGWRSDVLVVTAVNGEPPNPQQIRAIDAIAKKRHHSVTHALHDLQAFFGEVSVRIDELKFAVGDGLDRRHIIEPREVVAAPLKAHEIQVRKYLALANFGMALMQKRKRAWRRIVFRTAELVYFFPTTLPVVHSIRMNGSAQESLFMSEIAARLRLADWHSIIRNRNNVLVGHMVQLIRGQRKAPPARKATVAVPRLFSGSDPHDQVRALIERHRKFLDPRGLIEDVGGDNPYRLHADKLVKAVEEGEVHSRHFTSRGGHVSCIMPEHNDPGPSMMVYLKRGYAKCYACGAYLPFAPGSFSKRDIEERVRVKRRQKSGAPASFCFEDLETPPEHFRVMQLASEVLSSAFPGSRAEKYVRLERCIDPDLAREYGAGYGTERVVRVLLDELGFDGLKRYGFVGFSSNITPDQGLFPILKGRGMALEEVLVTVKERGKMVEKLPYFVLRHRLTFPLAFPSNRITNFYARAIDKVAPHLKHRKLSIEGTGVPHGMFNPDVLQSNAASIFLCEGVMDALTLMQALKFRNVTAVIGTRNYFILDAIARSGKEVAVALDNDAAGEAAAEDTIKWLRTNGFSKESFNFTSSFLQKQPDAADYDDWNSWWIARQKAKQ